MDAVNPEVGPDRGGRVYFVELVRGAGLSECEILICHLKFRSASNRFTRVTGADRLESDYDFEGTDRVETFAGSTEKRNAERMERLKLKNAWVGDYNSCLSGDAAVEKYWR